MKIMLIRHGMTAGNTEKRYIGRTDEPLCPEGIAALKACSYPRCEMLVTSPMQRCIQTASLLFPGQHPEICDAFRECDFGLFEGKNHAELNGNPLYQQWIDSGGKTPFPEGESPDAFRKRCCEGFLAVVRKYSSVKSIAMVVHGGTIMSVLSNFAEPHRDYFDWMTANGRGWCCQYDGRKLTVTENV